MCKISYPLTGSIEVITIKIGADAEAMWTAIFMMDPFQHRN